MRTTQRLEGLEAFVSVVKTGSFTAAARALGVSKSHVSKTIGRLEERLGARLLQRTTRTLSLTEAGAAFHERCRAILGELHEAEEAVVQMQTVPQGLLRMTVPQALGDFITPTLGEFARRYPDLEIEVSVTDRFVNLVEDGYDLAVRAGRLADSTLIARKLHPMSGKLCASAEYLEREGTPTTPEELAGRDVLAHTIVAPGPHFRLMKAGGQEIRVAARIRFSANDDQLLIEMARAGLGLVMMPDFAVYRDLQAGRLVSVMDEWMEWEGGVWAVYPHRRHLSAKVRLMVDALVERFTLCQSRAA